MFVYMAGNGVIYGYKIDNGICGLWVLLVM